jgi:hypothetical protein
MKCELTSKVAPGSQYARRKKIASGTVQPCSFDAVRRCPQCRKALCSGHSRQLTTMGRKHPYGQHRCSHCGYEGAESSFLGVNAAHAV